MIDIKHILTDHNIHWIAHGQNVSRGNVNITCPICGPEDKSFHMGIRLSDGYFGCWRNPKHSGKNIHRLLALLEIYVIEDDENDVMQQLINRTYFGAQELEIKTVAIAPKRLTRLPSEFIPIEEESLFTRPYLNYMRSRGFSSPLDVCKNYGLCFSIGADKWSRRLIIPTWIGDEVTWTGRQIGESDCRYLSPKPDEARSVKNCLWNYNELLKTEGDAIVIVEGPIDAIWLSSIFKDESIYATALFGLSIPETQINLLKKVCPNFKHVLIGLDQGTLYNSLQLMQELEEFSPVPMRLPKKDFNEMTPFENKVLVEKYLNEK